MNASKLSTAYADPAGRPVEAVRPTGARAMLERMALGAATTILSVNIWTGFPLLALWVGSRFAYGDPLSMEGIVIVLAVLIVLAVVGIRSLTWLSTRYDRLTGKPPSPRQPAPWLRSMRAERSDAARSRRKANSIEMIVVLAVVAAIIAIEIWFFFFAGSPLPTG
jgi:hypothetical protein